LQPATAQTPPEQVGEPLAVEQTLPQDPQFPRLVLVFTSQPLAAFPSQLPKPALQLATVQLPATHAAVPFAAEQVLPQAPQFPRLLCVFTSQPLAAIPSQSA
jgi:hypothetical protein